ncbi:hypothetical protein [Streptomyces sp. NPDC001388]|uniref:hypothetical protein n=1 Tax=Streptomyces sp. NPDC001388 TaxID=3364568 RepID=UPI0036C8096C
MGALSAGRHLSASSAGRACGGTGRSGSGRGPVDPSGAAVAAADGKTPTTPRPG